MRVPSKTALPFKVQELDPFGCLLEENVHNCVLLGWSLYFYSHKKNGLSRSTAHVQVLNSEKCKVAASDFMSITRFMANFSLFLFLSCFNRES